MADEIKDTKEIKYMDIKEFCEFGYLQELNRSFLHPLGLALEVVIEEDGSYHLGGVWDYRNEPSGVYYAESVTSKPTFLQKAKNIFRQMLRRQPRRTQCLGYQMQPVPGFAEWLDTSDDYHDTSDDYVPEGD
jgi:hypothetical protein